MGRLGSGPRVGAGGSSAGSIFGRRVVSGEGVVFRGLSPRFVSFSYCKLQSTGPIVMATQSVIGIHYFGNIY